MSCANALSVKVPQYSAPALASLALFAVKLPGADNKIQGNKMNLKTRLTSEILDDFKENSSFNGGINLELVRDWETPLTKFYEGHYNTPHNWAKLLNLSLNEFMNFYNKGQFTKWFKLNLTPFCEEEDDFF